MHAPREDRSEDRQPKARRRSGRAEDGDLLSRMPLREGSSFPLALSRLLFIGMAEHQGLLYASARAHALVYVFARAHELAWASNDRPKQYIRQDSRLMPAEVEVYRSGSLAHARNMCAEPIIWRD